MTTSNQVQPWQIVLNMVGGCLKKKTQPENNGRHLKMKWQIDTARTAHYNAHTVR